MAALLVGLSIMAVMLTVVMPVWKQTVRREKEAELVFRGEQYARAIGLFQRKSGPGTLPPTIDVLVQQRFLRKKYKDPITNDDFAPILLTAATQPGAQQPGAQPGAGAPARGGTGRAGAPPAGPFTGFQAGPTFGASGGITGVTSKSKEESIRIYKGRSHYNEWQFTFTPPAQAPGAGAPGFGVPGPGGQRGRGQGPGNPTGPFPPGAPGGPRGRPGGSGAPNGPFNPPPGGPIFPGQPTPRGR
jgi:type II secretory pathway pseudopilin PulG